MDIREKIAQREAELHAKYYNKKYGYHPWDKLPPVMKSEIYGNADQILTLIKEEDYVQLADNQNLPDKLFIQFKANPELTMPAQKELGDTAIMAYEQAQEDMLKAGWRKVEMTEGNVNRNE